MNETWGSRSAPGGYQAPRTNSAQLTRGKPLRQAHWKIGDAEIDLALVPFEGGRPDLFEIEYKLNDPVIKYSTYTPCMIRGAEYARGAFAATAAALDAGQIPDVVVIPPGTPLGP